MDGDVPRFLVQSRIFEAVVSRGALTGTLDDLAWEAGVTPSDFLDCLDELVRVRWVVLDADADGRYSIRLDA